MSSQERSAVGERRRSVARKSAIANLESLASATVLVEMIVDAAKEESIVDQMPASVDNEQGINR